MPIKSNALKGLHICKCIEELNTTAELSSKQNNITFNDINKHNIKRYL